ncbi:MAG: glycosyltransferase [Hyphomicrobiales bacterium]|nr:glycosyltransferase [Hyphomicrobiales bacterium]
MNGERPFAGKRVAIVHPAWHSCGTYQVVIGQIEAWTSLGAEVVTIACSDQPGFKPSRSWIWNGYRKATPELDAHERHYAGAPLHAVLEPAFLAKVLWPYIHGDQAVIRAGMISRAMLDGRLSNETFDLVHCNHFFCMPVALRLARGAKILLDSHDLQARQFTIMNEGAPWLRPLASYDQMLARELDWMARADVLLHLNAEEDDAFRALLPQKKHVLLYPPVPAVPTGPGGDEIVLVSSWNRANVESALWFLREVAPRAPQVCVRIYGSVDAGVRSADAATYEKYRGWFAGRVERIDDIYANAKLALLPTTSGTGLSIKSVEAMASGLPLIATAHAFRGMNIDPSRLGNVTLAEDAETFAAALRDAAARPPSTAAQRSASATRAAYDAHFSEEAYARQLAGIATPLIAATGRAPVPGARAG